MSNINLINMMYIIKTKFVPWNMAGSSQLALWIIIKHRVQKTRVISPKTKFANNKAICSPLQELLEGN